MFQLDEKFLSDIGLNELPEEQKRPFLQHVYDELEMRVGTQLSAGMTDEQLSEFESIIDRKDNIIVDWLNRNVPDYQNDTVFQQLRDSSKLNIDDPILRAEYAATKWLEVNRPDYRQVVAAVLDNLRKEIVDNRSTILS